MTIKKRSIGTSLSSSVSAIAASIELIPNGITRAGNVLSATADVTELYLNNWVEEKKISNEEDKVQRIARLEQLRIAVEEANIDVDRLNNFMEKMNRIKL